MNEQQSFVCSYSLDAIDDARQDLEMAEDQGEFGEAESLANDLRGKFSRLFTGPFSPEKAPAIVYYFKARIRDILRLDEGDDMDYDMADDRLLNEPEDDEVNRHPSELGHFEFLDPLEEFQDWRSSL